MGRLEIEIRHGHHHGGPAQWGAVVALIVLVLFAAAGHREIGTMLHEALIIVAIAFMLSVLALGVFIAVRIRAVRRARGEAARRYSAMAEAAFAERLYSRRPVPGADGTRPALDDPRRRPAVTWPPPGEWDQITPRDSSSRRRS